MGYVNDEVLSQFDAADPVAMLLAALMGSGADTRDPNLERLITTLNGPINKVLDRNAAEALGKLGDSRAVAPLMRLLKEGDTRVRAMGEEWHASGQYQRGQDALVASH